MDPQPDYITLSFWSRAWSIVDALDWVQSVTNYPRYRIFVDELGEWKDNKQYDHIYNNSMAARCWGVDLVNIWLWKQTWRERNYGLFEQLDGIGLVEFGDPRPGYWALRDLIDQPFIQEECNE
jgi:hypothetical protein